MSTQRLTSALATFAAAATLIACGNAKSPKPGFDGPVHPGQSTAAQRESVGITVYNSNFGLVREVRNIDVPTGRVELEFRDVASYIQPETVHVKSLTNADSMAIYEQNYRFDLLTPGTLLEKYVGKKVKLYRWNEATNGEDSFDAEVLSVDGGQPVYKIGDRITYGFPGRIAFPDVPANLIAKPTLVWLLGSSVAKQKLEVTYLTNGIGWQADYVLDVDDTDTLGDLKGWVTLRNSSGVAYENAQLKLVAGNVQHFQPPQDQDGAYDAPVMAKASAAAGNAAPSFVEEGFFEYHLYSLDQPTTLLDNEQKQVSLLEASGIKLGKKLIFNGSSYAYRSNYSGSWVTQNQKVGVFLDIENKESNHLGMPLPKGALRVYKKDKSGAKQFIGEDSIDHTPRDEKVRIKLGEAFDIVADKKQIDWKPLGTCSSESAYELSLRNHKEKAENVLVVEPAGGDWTIVASSHPSTKESQQVFTFDVPVPAKGEVKVTWRVRVRWC